MSENDLAEPAAAASNLWSWFKQHWHTVLLLAALAGCAYVIFSQKASMSSMLDEYRRQLSDSHSSIAALEQTVDQERTAREQMQQEFNERINDIDDRYTKAISDIRRDRSRRIRDLTSNTEELDRRFSERFGIAD